MLPLNNYARGLTWPGHAYGSSVGSSNLALSAANTQIAFAFRLRVAAGSLSKFRFYASGTGTVTSITIELRSDSGSNLPSATVLDTVEITSFNNTLAWREATFTGAITLDPGTNYWVVIKNTTGTPASNYITVYFQYGMMNGLHNTGIGYRKSHTTDGTTWANPVNSLTGTMLGMSDGSWVGSPTLSGGYFNTSGTDRAYTGVDIGGVGYSPDNVVLNVIGMGGFIRKVGSPGTLYFKLYSGVSLLSTSLGLPENFTSTSIVLLEDYFPRTVQIRPKDLLRLCFSSSGGDNTSNYYYTQGMTTDQNYPGQEPSELYFTKITSGAATDTAGKHPQVFLILDPVNPFVLAPLNRRMFNSGR